MAHSMAPKLIYACTYILVHFNMCMYVHAHVRLTKAEPKADAFN